MATLPPTAELGDDGDADNDDDDDDDARPRRAERHTIMLRVAADSS